MAAYNEMSDNDLRVSRTIARVEEYTLLSAKIKMMELIVEQLLEEYKKKKEEYEQIVIYYSKTKNEQDKEVTECQTWAVPNGYFRNGKWIPK
jgi:hypothetical protein